MCAQSQWKTGKGDLDVMLAVRNISELAIRQTIINTPFFKGLFRQQTIEVKLPNNASHIGHLSFFWVMRINFVLFVCKVICYWCFLCFNIFVWYIFHFLCSIRLHFRFKAIVYIIEQTFFEHVGKCTTITVIRYYLCACLTAAEHKDKQDISKAKCASVEFVCVQRLDWCAHWGGLLLFMLQTSQVLLTFMLFQFTNVHFQFDCTCPTRSKDGFEIST